MTPVVALIVRPAGNAGETVYEVTVPVTVGEIAVIAVPTFTAVGAV
jgi:hypothetical protein